MLYPQLCPFRCFLKLSVSCFPYNREAMKGELLKGAAVSYCRQWVSQGSGAQFSCSHRRTSDWAQSVGAVTTTRRPKMPV